ncbi:MAG: flavodoxin family protein [Candidatus Helarchaeota archaeon]
MKILITYVSTSGNTEAIAKSMAEGLAGMDLTIAPAEKVDPQKLAEFDLLFLGSGVYAGGAGKQINQLIKAAEALPEKVVLFCTHANPDSAFWSSVFKKVKKQLSKKNASVLAEFDCIGENKDHKVVEMLLKTQPQLKSAIEAAKGHPDATDLENAKKFAKTLIQQIKI